MFNLLYIEKGSLINVAYVASDNWTFLTQRLTYSELSRVGIHSQKSLLFFRGGIWSFLDCFTVWENAGMPENCRFIIDYEYQEKRRKPTN
jgi:hypothetical protein